MGVELTDIEFVCLSLLLRNIEIACAHQPLKNQNRQNFRRQSKMADTCETVPTEKTVEELKAQVHVEKVVEEPDSKTNLKRPAEPEADATEVEPKKAKEDAPAENGHAEPQENGDAAETTEEKVEEAPATTEETTPATTEETAPATEEKEQEKPATTP